MSSSPSPTSVLTQEFLVVCLCAAWCGTCRDYEVGFKELAARYPQVAFRWVDIEDENSGVEDWDVENFPTLVIQRNELVLFFGPMLPHHRILEQMLESYLLQSSEEARFYAHATPERGGWQGERNYRRIGVEMP